MEVSYSKLLKKLVDEGMTKRDLVEYAGITTNACTNISKQEPISMPAAIKICRAFDCSIGDIMDFSFEDEKPIYGEKILPGKKSDYVFDTDEKTGQTRIYKRIKDPDNPNASYLVLATIVDTTEITSAMFPDDFESEYIAYNLKKTDEESRRQRRKMRLINKRRRNKEKEKINE